MNSAIVNLRLAVGLGAALLVCSSPAETVGQVRRYDGLAAGSEAHALHEAQRQAQIANQLALRSELRWYGPQRYAYGTPWGFEGAYGPPRGGFYGADGYGGGYHVGPYDDWDARPPLFRLPGLSDQEARQPIGHRSVQTGPNRWEYHPVYAHGEQELDEQELDERELDERELDERELDERELAEPHAEELEGSVPAGPILPEELPPGRGRGPRKF